MTDRVANSKILVSVLALSLAVLIVGGWLDQFGRDYTEQGMKRTLIAFGVARGLNGVISVAQGTEVAVEPIGIGVTFTPGEILDPINDLIERFSWVVLASGVSLGAQRILLSMTAWIWFSGTVLVLMLVSISLLWKNGWLHAAWRKRVYKVTAVLLVMRFTVPVIAVINEGIYQAFLAPQYEESMAGLQQTSAAIEDLKQGPDTQQDPGFIERAKQMMQNASAALDVDKQLDKLKQAASEASEDALNMIVVFVLQTLLFPLFFLWLSYRFIVGLFRL